MAASTRLMLRVSPEAARAAGVGGTLGSPRSRVTLVSGSASRDKIVELAGIAPEEIERRLAKAGGQETA